MLGSQRPARSPRLASGLGYVPVCVCLAVLLFVQFSLRFRT